MPLKNHYHLPFYLTFSMTGHDWPWLAPSTIGTFHHHWQFLASHGKGGPLTATTCYADRLISTWHGIWTYNV